MTRMSKKILKKLIDLQIWEKKIGTNYYRALVKQF